MGYLLLYFIIWNWSRACFEFMSRQTLFQASDKKVLVAFGTRELQIKKMYSWILRLIYAELQFSQFSTFALCLLITENKVLQTAEDGNISLGLTPKNYCTKSTVDLVVATEWKSADQPCYPPLTCCSVLKHNQATIRKRTKLCVPDVLSILCTTSVILMLVLKRQQVSIPAV